MEQSEQDQQAADNRGALTTALFGAFIGLIGVPFVLMWAGLITPDPRKLHAPLWVVGCAGLTFVLAGVSVLIGAASSRLAPDGSLPDTAPRHLRILQDIAGLGIVAMLALIGSWVALGTDGSGITSTTTVLGTTSSNAANPIVGRLVFGFGAALCWLLFFWLFRQRWKKWWARQGSNL